MANIDHIMPRPRVVPIFWGHDYVANPSTTNNLTRLLSDLVAGPFMNGLAQYGVQRGSISAPVVIDDRSPPASVTYTDSSNQLKDEITKLLIRWVQAGVVPPPSSANDVNQLYVILPPPETTPQFYNGASDPVGNGVQGLHNEGNTNPGPPPRYYWVIVKTNDVGDISTPDFVNNVALKLGHELVEQFANRNGSFEELGDPCNDTSVIYRGWTVQQYRSEWDNGCISGDNPVSLSTFLRAAGFDLGQRGLRSLGVRTINVDYIAETMRSH